MLILLKEMWRNKLKEKITTVIINIDQTKRIQF